jgi:hypothetical protein
MKRTLKKTIFRKGDCALPYWTNSEERGPWIVLIHGPCVDHRSFDPLLSQLKDETRCFCATCGSTATAKETPRRLRLSFSLRMYWIS